jgi:hypothetical protein
MTPRFRFNPMWLVCAAALALWFAMLWFMFGDVL